jgi:hypothetical protein
MEKSMTLPAFIFGFLLATLYGALFHLWRGGNAGRLLLYITLSWSGFAIGQIAATRLGWTFLSFGPLNVGMATVLSLVFLLLGYWLSLIDIDKNTSKK